jgi:hypothetical protein
VRSPLAQTRTIEPMASQTPTTPSASTTVSALPSVGARVLGVIGYAFVDLQLTGDSSLWAGLGALFGAVVAALGTAVVVILTLRAMGEWNTIRAREELAAASAKSNAANRNVPRVR